MLIMKLRWEIGKTLANCGELTFRHGEESERFRTTVRSGIMPPGFEGILESGWESRP